MELCLDKILKNMGLDYIDLFLAHWPVALTPISREALQKAVTSPKASNVERGILKHPDTQGNVVDWEHSSVDVAARAGGSKASTH